MMSAHGKKQSAKPKNNFRGAAGFDEWYTLVYGERWPRLRAALGGEPAPVCWNAGARAVSAADVSTPYYLDRGSILAALALPLDGAERILDMCAAPGGKTVVLASMMPDGALLTANERSAARRARLAKTIAACLPPDVQRRVRVTGADAAALCRHANTHEQYDRILLDAPCSSERHVLRDARYLNEWSYSRIRSLAAAQWSLISSAYRLLARGGKLVYATCALSPEENDCIIERFTAKYPDMTVTGLPQIPRAEAARFCADPLSAYEQTRCGFHVLPDVQSGAGPLFFSCLNKAP